MRHDKSGQWSADIGYKLARGKAQRMRFYFGHDEVQARIYHQRINALWEAIKIEYGRWEDWLLMPARGVAKGGRGEVGFVPGPYRYWPGALHEKWNPQSRQWEEVSEWTKKPYGRFLEKQAWKDIRGSLTTSRGTPLINDWCYSAKNREKIVEAYLAYLRSLFGEWLDFDGAVVDQDWEIHPNTYVDVLVSRHEYERARAGSQRERVDWCV